MVRQHHQLFVALLVLMDGLVASAASVTGWVIRRLLIEREWWPTQWEHYFKESGVLFAVPIVLITFNMFGLYRPRRDRSLFLELFGVARGGLFAVLVLLGALYVYGSSIVNTPYPDKVLHAWGLRLDAGRVQLGSLAVLLPLFLCVHRAVFRVTLRQLRRRGWNQRHVAIIGTGRLGQIAARTLMRNSWTGISVAYFIAHHGATRRSVCLDRPVFGGLADLERTMEQHRVDAVYLALPSSSSDSREAILATLEKFPVDVRIIPDVNPRHLPQSMAVSELDGMPILSYRECPTHGLAGGFKRVIDLGGAVAALAIFGLPMLVIAGLVRLSGPGPVIFKQRRVSIGGDVFKIYKFRTMRHVEDEQGDAFGPAGARWTERDDPRITSIGLWLRKSSLDELPQLFNVLRGDMSLVGPRPERPELIARFREDWRGYMLRHHVKAGMTGWAQVNGLRGQSSLRKRLQYDLFYIRHWSLSFDIRILVMTVFRGFVHRNAH